MHHTRRTDRGIVAALLIGVAATSCSEPTKPHASITVALVSEPMPRSSASANGSPFWTGGFSVDVVATNPSDYAVKIGSCGGPELEHESQPDVWSPLGMPMCALSGGSDFGTVDVPPRSERRWRQEVYPLATAAQLSPGRFRLLFLYWTVGTWGRADEARSAPFELK